MQRSMAFTEMAQKSLAHIPELLVYRDDICVLSVTWENQFVGEYFCRVANSRFDLKMSFGPKSVTHLGNLFFAEGVAVGTEHIQAIFKNLPRPAKSYRVLRSSGSKFCQAFRAEFCIRNWTPSRPHP